MLNVPSSPKHAGLSSIIHCSIVLLNLPLYFLQILDVTGFLKYAVQSSAQFEARFNAVERILQYRKLEPESARKVSACLQAGDCLLQLPKFVREMTSCWSGMQTRGGTMSHWDRASPVLR